MGIAWSDFQAAEIEGDGATIFTRRAGSGPPLLLLHGFPETHLMWRDVAPAMVDRFTIVCADLRGYGQSSCPQSTEDHAPYSKRAMAADMIAVMRRLGFQRFAVAGHDRGGRVAYRMALDHPDRITRLAVLDVIPTADVWDRAGAEFAMNFWPWVLLAQPAPLPERLIAATPDAIVADAANEWGSDHSAFPSHLQVMYAEALRNPARVHAICEEYRAGATLDRDHDAADRASGKRIDAPALVLWSARGPLAKWYETEGGPLALWKRWATNVRGHAVDGGHFFPEERPAATAAALAEILG